MSKKYKLLSIILTFICTFAGCKNASNEKIEYSFVEKEGEWNRYCIDTNGNLVSDVPFQLTSSSFNDEGIAYASMVIQVGDTQKEVWGYIDSETFDFINQTYWYFNRSWPGKAPSNFSNHLLRFSYEGGSRLIIMDY